MKISYFGSIVIDAATKEVFVNGVLNKEATLKMKDVDVVKEGSLYQYLKTLRPQKLQVNKI